MHAFARQCNLLKIPQAITQLQQRVTRELGNLREGIAHLLRPYSNQTKNAVNTLPSSSYYLILLTSQQTLSAEGISFHERKHRSKNPLHILVSIAACNLRSSDFYGSTCARITGVSLCSTKLPGILIKNFLNLFRNFLPTFKPIWNTISARQNTKKCCFEWLKALKLQCQKRLIKRSKMRANLEAFSRLAKRALQRLAAAFQSCCLLALHFQVCPHFLQLGLHLETGVERKHSSKV